MKINISHMTIPNAFHSITDLYIPDQIPQAGILYPNAVPVSEYPEYFDLITFLITEARKNKLEFSLELEHEQNRIIFRGHSINSIEGKVYIFRRLPSFIPDIEELGMQKNIIELLTHDRLNQGGLVIVAGETGQGKSTTAAAAIAHRLKTYGSFCLTIEDPVELPLQGFYEGDKKRGVCFQTQADGEGITEAIKSSLRCYPSISNSILFLGETRDAVMASEVLKIAANGHLVITTLHGADLLLSLKRFMGLAMADKNSNEAEVKSMFSSVFRLIIHQKMEIKANGNRQIKQKVLFSSNVNSNIASRLKSGSIEMLSTDVQNQNMMLDKGSSIINPL